MPTAHEKFVAATGINISRATFFRMKKELQSGNSSRLKRIADNADIPKENRKAYKKHGDKDTVPFLSYDGEGITVEGKHSYVLLACSNGESIYRPDGISTVDALNFLLRSKDQRRIRIFFAFGYDVQQITRDLADSQLVALMHGEQVRYRSFRLSYLPGKIFSVNNVKFYDVFNYWQKSFIKAVTETLGPNAVSQSLIVGKESRSDFADWRLDDILSYTNEELALLNSIADHLRTILVRADIHLGSNFYGPGSIANFWFKRYQISPPRIENPALIDVMERAYYGGRFETFRLGRVEPIYEYDINSAYPAVIANLPYLDGWEHRTNLAYHTSVDWSVWKVKWNIPPQSKIGPFPSRDRHGLISYPANGIGWYWKPEIEAAISIYGTRYITVSEGYEPTSIKGTPFDWVRETYDRRLELKEQGDPAQQGLKIGLNSIYGKTAQRVGSAKYFSLAWAGFITASTRAKLLSSIVGREANVIAFATDAVYFDREQQGLRQGKQLGDFSGRRWLRGYFLQSGVYRLEDKDGHKDAYRGFSVKNGIQNLLDQIQENPFRHPAIYQIKFISHLEAIRCPKTLGPYRLSFITVRKRLQPFKTTKRRVTDKRVWSIIEDAGWIDENAGQDFVTVRGDNYISPDGYAMVWNNYSSLLNSSVDTEILEHHNDHSDIVHTDKGELEESYPFMRLTDRQDDIAFHAVDEVAIERLGGANGIIDLAHVGKLPIVDEDLIIQELTSAP
jgi:hypothetical protein